MGGDRQRHQPPLRALSIVTATSAGASISTRYTAPSVASGKLDLATLEQALAVQARARQMLAKAAACDRLGQKQQHRVGEHAAGQQPSRRHASAKKQHGAERAGLQQPGKGPGHQRQADQQGDE